MEKEAKKSPGDSESVQAGFQFGGPFLSRFSFFSYTLFYYLLSLSILHNMSAELGV